MPQKWALRAYSFLTERMSVRPSVRLSLIRVQSISPIIFEIGIKFPGPRRAVGNVSGYRCQADCRSRGCEFDPGPVPYFRGD